jgi:hypothetical protein
MEQSSWEMFGLSSGKERAVLYAFLDNEKMHTTSFVPGDDVMVVGERAATRERIAMECGDGQAGIQVPYFNCFVPRSGCRPLPVRRHGEYGRPLLTAGAARITWPPRRDEETLAGISLPLCQQTETQALPWRPQQR